ncbi:MAG: NigD-like N-terminal domain-containing protein [Bacteroidaceae bacterium]|nr:NigD-like N-terminal domain-containing protein [Bacteroidaceae bacterium]
MRKPVSLTLFLLFLCLSSCHDDDDAPYPSIITEMVDCPTDDEGTMTSILLDDDTRLTLTNPQTGLKKDVTYRALAGFTRETDRATLYSLTGVPLLHDSTAVAQTDPTNVVSLWRTSRYLNLHLLPKTQGQGQHTWGYIVDSMVDRHAYLRLHHRQDCDPTAYSTDVYVSMPLTEVDADTLTFVIETFTGTREWVILLDP